MRPLASTTGRRPAKPTRLRASRSETHVRPDEVVERWVENPYWPYFCGFDFFQHRLPIDSSTMTRWRRRVGPEGMRFCRRQSVLRLTREQSRTAVSSGLRWPKAIAYPTDSRLYLKALQALVRQAKRHGIVLRRSHTRVARRAALMAGRYAHARQFRRMRREIRKLKTYLGWVFRDIVRKISGNAGLEARFAKLLGLASSGATARGQEQALCPARSGSCLHRQG